MQNRGHRCLTGCGIVVVLVLSIGCGFRKAAPAKAGPQSAPASGEAGKSPSRIIEGLAVQRMADELVGKAVYDAEELFHLAGEAERNKGYDRSRLLYARLLEDFPESRFWLPSAFNLGLLYEATEDYEKAMQRYKSIVSLGIPLSDHDRRIWLDAHFRVALGFSKASKWYESAAWFGKVLEMYWIDEFDRLEALSGRGIALQEAGELDEADVAFAAVLRFHRHLEREGRFDDRGLVAESAFRMGDIAATRYEAVILEFPAEKMRALFEEKCAHLLAAQNRYLRAIRHGDRHTVAAAGFRIGSLYEDLYKVIVALPKPGDVEKDTGQIYDEEVRKRVRILVKKAIRVYEKALAISKRVDSARAWVDKLESALERLKSIYMGTKGSQPS